MFETQNFGDALEKAEPRLHPRRKNRALIQANCEAIYAARDRGCTWADIAKALSEAGFTVSPNALRLAINSVPRDLKKYPRKMLAQRKPRRKQVQRSIESNREMQGGASDKERRHDAVEIKPEASVHVPVSRPKSFDPNSFAGIRRLNMKI